MFFEYYTENLWGRHPREIDASWGAQRVKGLSIVAILQDIFGKIFNQKNRKVETSLIEQFLSLIHIYNPIFLLRIRRRKIGLC